MTEFKIGDIVRMTKGEPDTPGYECRVKRVGTYTDHLRNQAAVPLTEVPTLIRAYGWTVELLERPAAPLPTTPNTLGWATVGGTRRLARLACSQWELYSANGSLGAIPHPSTIEDFEEAVLIPKELADKIIEWTADPFRLGATIGGVLDQIAAHLKGQNDE